MTQSLRKYRGTVLFNAWLIFVSLVVPLVIPALADSSTGEISENEVIAYVKNTWGWAEFSDNAIIVALDGSYSGLPFRDYVKVLIVGWDFQNLYDQGKLKEAGGVLANYAAKKTVKQGLQQVGMGGVVPVANLATWPVEWGINRFRVAVNDSAHELHLLYYFAARAHNSYSEIANAGPGDLIEADVNGGLLTKSDQGWLYRSGGFVNAVPGMTPAEFFSEAERHWLCDQSKSQLQNDNITLRQAFGAVLEPAGPVITSDLADQTITDGQTATFTIAVMGVGPFGFSWFLNGSLMVGASSSSLDTTEPGQYRVTVLDANNRTAQSRNATLTVNLVGTPVALTSPTAGATVSGNYTVRANATGASKVEFWLDGARRFTDSSAPFTWTWNTALDDNGTHQLVAKSFSGTNLLAATPSRTVTVDNTVLPPGPESFEPNESSLSATPLAFGTTTNGYIWTSRDMDWFSVNVSTPGVVTFDLTMPLANDYDLEIFGPDAAYLAGSYQNTGLAEHIAFNAIRTGTYWVRIYGYPVGNGSYNTNFTYTLTATVSSGPVTILSHPQDRTLPAGSSASFSVTVTGALPLSYQWQRDGVDVAGATSPTYATPMLTPADNGEQYRVRVFNSFTAVTSTVASLTVTAANNITWTGGGDGWNWNNPTNWSSVSVPGWGDSILITSGSVSVPADAHWSVLTLAGGTLHGTFTNEGTLTWSAGMINGKMTIAPGGVLNITGTASNFGGMLDNYGTVIWTANSRFLGGSDLSITNRAGALFDIRTNFDINNGGGGTGPGYSYSTAMPRFINYGTLTKSAGTGTNSLSITTFENSGLLQVATGGLKFLHGYSQIAGNTLLAGGSISGTTMNLSGGRLSGIGLINAAVVNGAIVSPGNSTGTLTINGNYTQTASGSLHLEIGGTNPDSQYDRLKVTGTANLGGEMRVSWTNAFVPSTDDSFQVMTFGSAVGSFATTNGLAFGNGIVLTSQRAATSLTLQATDWSLFDSDDDGMNDWLETLAGTSPNDPFSCLRMLPLLQIGPAPDSGFIVQWQSVAGRFYTVNRSTNLTESSAFIPVKSHIEGLQNITTYTDTNAVGPGPIFYRVRVEQ